MYLSFGRWQREFWQGLPNRSKPATENASTEFDGEDSAVVGHRGQISSGHEFPTIYASGHANLHLGDVHYHTKPPSATAKEQLMSTLHFPEMFKRFENIQEPHSDTFQWILNPPKRGQPQWSSFAEWLYQKGGLYWISGKPGSGKSVLTKYLAQCVQQERGEEEGQSPVVLSFWFWEAAHTSLERDLFGCLRSLLWQLLNHPRHGEPTCKAIDVKSTFEWTMQRLRDALDDALVFFTWLHVPVLIFLDGLDECGKGGKDVLSFATGIVKQHSTLKLCVSSRPEPLYQVSLLHYPQLRMHNLNRPDVYAIIDQDLLQAPEFNLVTGKQHQGHLLRHQIAEMAQGVLLWVRLVVRDLLQGIIDGDTVDELQKRLTNLPSELDGEFGLYAFMLKRNAANASSYLADAAFYLHLASRREMSVIDFCLATDENLRASYIRLVDGWERLHLDVDLNRVARAISARTAGLLEVVSRPSRRSQRAAKTRCAMLTSILDAHEMSSVGFIHRTAHTYIFGTSAGHQILAASTKTTDDLTYICFETWLISWCVLRGLESIAPISLRYPREAWFGSTGCSDQTTETRLRTARYLIGQLEQKSFLQTTPYQSLLWTSRFFCPKRNEHQISFDILFASLGIWNLVSSDILDISVSEPSENFCRFSSVLQALRRAELLDRLDGRGREFRDPLDDRGIYLCKKLLCYCPGPDVEITNTDGEQIPGFCPIALIHEGLPIEAADLTDPWLRKASASTLTKRCKPIMARCSQMFFYTRFGVETTIIGALSYVDLAPLLRSSLGRNDSDQLSINLNSFGTSFVLFQWPKGAWQPIMYELPPTDAMTILQEILQPQNAEDLSFEIGMITVDGNRTLPILDPISLSRFERLKSLSEAFQILGKGIESINNFATAEEDRIRLAYDEVIYRHWRSWMYGTDEPFLRQYQHISRPKELEYSLDDEDSDSDSD